MTNSFASARYTDVLIARSNKCRCFIEPLEVASKSFLLGLIKPGAQCGSFPIYFLLDIVAECL